MTRLLVALCLVVVPLASIGACHHVPHSERASAGATKPTGPAEGAGDYWNNPGGPATAPQPPVTGDPRAEPTETPPGEDCPPKCSADGSWIGCGLKKPRGTGCTGCVPKCKGKGTSDEGWYDCNGVLIAQRKCS